MSTKKLSKFSIISFDQSVQSRCILIEYYEYKNMQFFTSTNFCRRGDIRPPENYNSQKILIWVWLDIWKFWKYPLKANKNGKFEGVTWKNPPNESLSSIFQCNFFGWSRKNFTAGSQKSRFVIILTSKWYILIIYQFQNGHIAVIFKIFKPVPYPDFRV